MILPTIRASFDRQDARYLWPGGGDPVNRLLREVTQRVDRSAFRNRPAVVCNEMPPSLTH